MIAAQQAEVRLIIDHKHQALDLRCFGQARKLGNLSDGLAIRCVELFGFQVAIGIRHGGRHRTRNGLLHVRRVANRFARDHVIFTGLGGHHEFVRLAATH